MCHNLFRISDEVLAAADRDSNGIPEDDIEIVGRVDITQTRFEDTTVFEAINIDSEDPYYYAVVPVDAMGIMGTPSIVPNSIVPEIDTVNGAPGFFIQTQPRGTGEWQVQVQSTQPLQSAPHLTVESPNKDGYTIFLRQETATKWIGTLRTNGFPTDRNLSLQNSRTDPNWRNRRQNLARANLQLCLK